MGPVQKSFWEESYKRSGKLDTFGGGKPSQDVVTVAAEMKPGLKALDMGCGEGRNALYLASIGFITSAVDISVSGIEKLKMPRSKLPAITHVDYSARIQTVNKDTNQRYYQLLEEFGRTTGYPVLINTSFNVRGEPIVCTPEDAYRCFINTEIDYLVLENCLLSKKDQPNNIKASDWLKEFEPD